MLKVFFSQFLTFFFFRDGEEGNTEESQPPIMTPQPVFHDYLGPERELSSEEKLKAASQHID